MEKGNTGSFTAGKRKKPRASGRKYGMNNKVILVTGGTGSFGQKFTETVSFVAHFSVFCPLRCGPVA